MFQKESSMLRSNHVLSLALLVSVPAFAMQGGKQLVAAAADQSTAVAQPTAPSAALLSTVLLLETCQSQLETRAKLQQQKTVIDDAEKATSMELSAGIIQLTEKLGGKKKQIDGSKTAISLYQEELAKLDTDAAQEEAAIKTKKEQKKADLLAKISKEEVAKKALEAEAATIEKQITPEIVEGPAEAPKTSWFGWFTTRK